ncbi:MAG: hypothetical protein IPK87_11805 [Planctomycetes bacterium]|nr:hypothetical protein [Planctomycetota bacterium]
MAKRRFDELTRQGKAPGQFCVAEISISKLHETGLSATADPLPDNPGHALIPELNAAIKGTKKCKELQSKVQAAVIKLHGPFDFRLPPGAEGTTPIP